MSFSGENTSFTMPVAPTAMYGGNGGLGGWGDNSWWIILFLIFGMFGGGWGNGFGGGYGMNGGVGSEVQRGFDHSAVVQKLDGITTGIADATYALNNTVVNGFNGVERAICNVGYQTQAGFNSLAHQISDCCCTTQRAIDGVNYNLATQACDTRHAIQDSTRQILDFLTNDKITSLQAENTALKFQASQSAQNGFIDAVGNSIVAQLRMPTPVPAYQVPNPYASYGYGCGCNPCGC